jgi:hypothetical protein
MKRFGAVLCAVVCVCQAWPRAFQRDLDARAIQEAIAIGQSRISGERQRFHAPYRVQVAHAPVDYIDVITPFRRVVLDAQAQAEIGNHDYGQRSALQALAAASGAIELDVELTFSPLNTYIGVPDYRVALVPSGGTAPRIEPESLDRVPRFGPRVAGVPLPSPRPGALALQRHSEPMLGGTLIARYDSSRLDANGRYDVVVSEAGKELARAGLDFSRLR